MLTGRQLADCQVKEPGLPVLLMGYGLVLALMLLYWWEGGKWHKNRKYESLYVVLVLLLVPVTNFAAAYRKQDLCFYQSSSWELAEMLFRQVLQLLLIFEMQRFTWPQVHPQFFDWRPLCSRPVLKGSRQAGGVARDVEQTLAEVLAQSPVLLPEGLLAPFVFGFSLLEEVLWSLEDPGRIARICGYVSVAAILLALVNMIYMMSQTEPQIKHLHDVVNRLVSTSDKDTLQYVLANVSVATLLEVGGDAMLELLTDMALERNMLSLLAKAIIVNALQQKGVYFCKASQRAVVRLMLSCKGEHLTALKNVIDGSGNYNNLFKLVYTDMRKLGLRQQLRDHISEQGTAVRRKIGCSFGIKVLSDVDDTLYSSGGHFPAGCDKRYPKHMVYPGFLSLFRVLNRERGQWGQAMKGALSLDGVVSCDLVFLSARPHIYKDVAEGQSYRLFRSLVREEKLHCVPTLIPGVLGDGLRAMLMHPFRKTAAWRQVGVNKYRTYLRFRSLYPEYDFVFFGDNGQGDLYAAQLMVDRQGASELSPRQMSSLISQEDCRATAGDSDADSAVVAERNRSSMVAAFIHEVLPEAQALAREPPDCRGPAWREALQRQQLLFHRTYVGAALALHESRPDLVTLEDLQTVAHDAIREFEADKLAYAEWASRWEAAAGELSQDLARATQALIAGGQLPVPRLTLLSPTASQDRSPAPVNKRRTSVPMFFTSGCEAQGEESNDGDRTSASQDASSFSSEESSVPEVPQERSALRGPRGSFAGLVTKYCTTPTGNRSRAS